MKPTAVHQEHGNGRVSPGTAGGIFKGRAYRRGQRGFTLVELLAVMAIIGILAGVVSGAMSGLGATGQEAQIQSDTKTIETAADRFFNESFPQTYPVEELPAGQTDLGVRAINFDARLPQDPTKTLTPDFIKDIPNSTALVSYRIETATGNVFAAADGADFAPPADSRLNVSQTNKLVSVTGQTPQLTDLALDLTMGKNRAAVEILKVQIPAGGYSIGGLSLAAGTEVGKLRINFAVDNPWKSGHVVEVVAAVVASGEANKWNIVADYATATSTADASPVAKVLLDPASSSTAPTLTHTISIATPTLETPGTLTLTMARPTVDVVAHNRATETWTLTIGGTSMSGTALTKLVSNPSVAKVYRWVSEEHSTIQVEKVFDPVAGKQAILVKPAAS